MVCDVHRSESKCGQHPMRAGRIGRINEVSVGQSGRMMKVTVIMRYG